MGFLGSLFKGAVGFATGGPAGAALAIGGDLLAGSARSSAIKRAGRFAQQAGDQAKMDLISGFDKAQGFISQGGAALSKGFDQAQEFVKGGIELGQGFIDRANDPKSGAIFEAQLAQSKQLGASIGSRLSTGQIRRDMFVASREEERRSRLREIGARFIQETTGRQAELARGRGTALAGQFNKQGALAADRGVSLGNIGLQVGGIQGNLALKQGESTAQTIGGIAGSLGRFGSMFSKGGVSGSENAGVIDPNEQTARFGGDFSRRLG